MMPTAVEMFTVDFPSPPVPQVSTVPFTPGSNVRLWRFSATASAASSSTVSPRSFMAMSDDAICDSARRPCTIASNRSAGLVEAEPFA